MATYSVTGVDPRLAIKVALTDESGTKIDFSATNAVPISGSISAVPQHPATSSATRPTTVTSSTSQMILAANANRQGAIVFNEGGALMYVLLGSPATASFYSYQMASLSTLELPFGYVGAVSGICASGTAQPMATELTA